MIPPAFGPFAIACLPQAYRDAREDAAEETGLPETEFPTDCPLSLDELLSRSYFPEQ